jgi:hypothetical protein
MSDIDDGGPAFPVQEWNMDGSPASLQVGMSQRALFAAILMHSELTTCGVPGEACEALIHAAEESGREVEDQMAHNAVQCADALLRALAAPMPPRLSYEEQKQIREHEKMAELLVELQTSGSIALLPPAQRYAIERLAPVIEPDDGIPF